MIAVQALEKRTAELQQKEVHLAMLESRLEALELRNNHFIQITAEERHLIIATGSSRFAVICSADDTPRAKAKDRRIGAQRLQRR